MKKLLFFFILTIGFSSCSNDDSTTPIATPLEGDWLLVYKYAGDPGPDDPPPGDISERNIIYHFNRNSVKITENGELVFDESFFSFIQEEGHYKFIYNQYPDDSYRVDFINDNTIANFTRLNLYIGFTLKKIQ